MTQQQFQIGNYRIVRGLDSGSFGAVYLAENIYLGNQVAIKLLHGVPTEKEIQAFLTEARTIANLGHPNIIKIFDFGPTQHPQYPANTFIPYLIMEYLPNGNMRSLQQRGNILELNQVIDFVKQIAGALQCAHDNGIIHRDVKPENILLDKNGGLVLSDFGIATVAHRSQSMKTEREVALTASYGSPEQFEGKAYRTSDQYALGIMVYEWLTGNVPFTGNWTQVGYQHIHVAPPSPRSINPLISEDVEQIILKALAKDPKARFDSVQAFAQALEETATGTQRSEQLYGQEHYASTAYPNVETPLLLPGSAATTNLNVAKTQQVNVLPPAPTLPTNVAPGTVLTRYNGHIQRVTGLCWSPNGNHIASVGGDEFIHVWEATTGKAVARYPGAGTISWSPNGKYLVTKYVKKEGMCIIEATTGHIVSVHEDSGNTLPFKTVWSTNNRFIASFISENPGWMKEQKATVQVWEATSGHGFEFAEKLTGFSTDGKFSVSEHGNITILWDTTSGKEVARFADPTSLYSPDGIHLVTIPQNKSYDNSWYLTTFCASG